MSTTSFQPDLDPIIHEDLTPICIPVTFRKKQFFLVEAKEDYAIQYRNRVSASIRYADGQMAGVAGIANVEPFLVSLCLYAADQDGNLPLDSQGEPDGRALVPEMVLRGWPSRFVKRLFKRAKQISDLDTIEETDPIEIQKQIDRLTKRLEELKGGEISPKDNTSNGQDTSS